MTRCPCRLVSMSSGSTYAEKYARYVEFRLSFSALRLFPEALFFAVDRNVRGSSRLARAPISCTAEEYPFLRSSSLRSVTWHPLCIVASLLFRFFPGEEQRNPICVRPPSIRGTPVENRHDPRD